MNEENELEVRRLKYLSDDNNKPFVLYCTESEFKYLQLDLRVQYLEKVIKNISEICETEDSGVCKSILKECNKV